MITFMKFLENQIKLFGWLLPSGKFIQTEMYGHVYAAANHPDLQQFLPPWFATNLKDVENLEKTSLTAQDAGEHPEWHSYEMASEDLGKIFVHSLYSYGILRVGSVGNSIHFEGYPEGIQNTFQVARQFAEEHGMLAEFQPIKKNQRGVTSRFM